MSGSYTHHLTVRPWSATKLYREYNTDVAHEVQLEDMRSSHCNLQEIHVHAVTNTSSSVRAINPRPSRSATPLAPPQGSLSP